MPTIFPIPNLLSRQQVDELLAELNGPKAKWTDGKATAGRDASKKSNQELDPLGKLRIALSDRLQDYLLSSRTSESLMFQYNASPRIVAPFLFSKTGAGGGYADHIDNNFMALGTDKKDRGKQMGGPTCR
jgi:predicted 2-oxoglutarate/Fe(II)-dependent dioxygenase YbiX